MTSETSSAPSKVYLKALSPDDWPLWRELRLQALTEAPYAFGATLAEWTGDGDKEQRWRARLSIPGSRNLIAYLEGRPVGMGSGVPADIPDGGIEIISLWVNPVARGREVGDRLLDDIEQWATGLEKQTMRLAVRPSNMAAIRLYRRHGLRETDEEGDLTPGGTNHELVMAKSLYP